MTNPPISTIMDNDPLLLKTLSTLPLPNLRSSRLVSKHLNSLISNSSALQYTLLIDELGLVLPELQDEAINSKEKLRKLKEMEARMREMKFGGGQGGNRREGLEVDDWMAVIPGAIEEADDEIYMLGGYDEHTQEATHIIVIDLNNLQAPRRRIDFGHNIKSFLIDAHEGTIAVTWLEQQVHLVEIVFYHRVQVFDLKDMRPLVTGGGFRFPWSLQQVRRATELLSMRGRLLSICCAKEGDFEKGVVRIYDVFAGRLLSETEHKVINPRHAGLAGCQIISANTALVIWAAGPVLELRVLAVDGQSVSHVATFHMPKLHPAMDYARSTATSSGTSLSRCSKKKMRTEVDCMQSGQGIVSLSLYIRGNIGAGPGYVGTRWTSAVIAIMPISMFEDGVKNASTTSNSIRQHPWATWGPQRVFWSQDMPICPSKESICGYRIVSSGDEENDLPIEAATPSTPRTTIDLVHPQANRVSIYDFSPVRIRQYKAGMFDQDPNTTLIEGSSPFYDPNLAFECDPRSSAAALVTRKLIEGVPLLGLHAHLSPKRIALRAIREIGTDPVQLSLTWQFLLADAAPEIDEEVELERTLAKLETCEENENEGVIDGLKEKAEVQVPSSPVVVGSETEVYLG